MPVISSSDGVVLERKKKKKDAFPGELWHILIGNCLEFDTSTQCTTLIQKFSQTTKWEVHMLLLFQASSRE